MGQGRRRNDDIICRERASCIQRNVIQRTSETAKVVEKTSIHHKAEPTTAELLLRNIVSVNQLSTYGANADWCQELAHRVEAHSPQSRTPVAKVDNDPATRVPSVDVSSLTKGPLWSPRARRNLVRQHDEKCEYLPEDLPLTKACDDAGFMRNVSQGQLLISIPDVHLEGYGPTSSCREYTYPRLTRGNTKIGPALEVMVTNVLTVMEIEIKIDSMKKDVTQPWMAVSRGVQSRGSHKACSF